MKPYINIDEMKYDIQQQAENLPDYIMEALPANKKINLQKAIKLQDSAFTMFASVPYKDLFEAINNSIMDTLRDFDDDEDKFEYSANYIKDQIWALTQISNFIACAIPD